MEGGHASGGGDSLDWASVASLRGLLRLLQAALSCAALSLAVHRGGWTFSYGLLCLGIWATCLALSAALLVLELSRLSACLPTSWANLTVSLATLCALLCASASVLYPLFSLRSYNCYFRGCESVRAFRIATCSCSVVACAAYVLEVAVSVARPPKSHVAMASLPGLLKVIELFCGAVILGAVFTGGQHGRFLATHWCIAVYCACLALTTLLGVLWLRGPEHESACACGSSPHRASALGTLLSVLLYLSAAVIWPVYAFDPQYGSPTRPTRCEHERCPWDAHVIVAVFTFINLLVYVLDLSGTHRAGRAARTRTALSDVRGV
uniref:myeloid-associated differentiation marker-like protein 2 n=1 Tax=Myxine glutinosa TaxID=7769 RepID=UPI00358E0881